MNDGILVSRMTMDNRILKLFKAQFEQSSELVFNILMPRLYYDLLATGTC